MNPQQLQLAWLEEMKDAGFVPTDIALYNTLTLEMME